MRAREKAASEAGRKHADEHARLKREHEATIAALAALTPARGRGQGGAQPAAEAAVAGASVSGDQAKRDDLKLIWGVGPEIERLLNEQCIKRFAQMALWGEQDIAWFESLLPNFKGRVETEKWVEQARRLSTGWRPEREVGERPEGLEILNAPRGGKPDDLKLIWGVGPKLEKLLNKAGSYHFDQIAKWTDKQLAWVNSQLGDFAGRAEREKWIEQAQKLATGWRPSKDAGYKPV